MKHNSDEQQKASAAKAAMDYVRSIDLNGKVIGIGTGSTTAFFITAIAEEHARKKLSFTAVFSSIASQEQALKLMIEEEHGSTKPIEIYFDGADEITPQGTMIKGGGGALFREKILSTLSKKMCVMVHEKKLQKKIGSVPLPLEITPFCFTRIQHYIAEHIQLNGKQRQKNNKPYITNNENYILDISLPEPLDDQQLRSLHTTLINIPGVVETGIFFDVADKIFVGHENDQTTCIDLGSHGK